MASSRAAGVAFAAVRARWVVLLLVLSNLLTLALVLGFLWYDERRSFDVAAWHSRLPGDCNDDHRAKMVDDLAEGYLRVGMSRADVGWLLGPPDSSQEAEGGARLLLGWDVGIDASDCKYFYVNFGPGGRTVVEWSRSED
jgi:hypothetical protein